MENARKICKELKELWRDISKGTDWTYCSMIILILVGYILAHDLMGETLLLHNSWDSYTLQAKAWLDGRLGLGQNYGHLELAIYKGDWFVSFPPFPSVAILPWVLIFGENTPNNLIMIIYIMIAATIAYRIGKHFKMRDVVAAFWTTFVVFGCNILWMSTIGGVWFQAQVLNMVLCLGAILAMLNNKRIISYICMALAVGCRPFSIFFFFVLLVYYYEKDKKFMKNKSVLGVIKVLLKQWPGILSAGIIGCIYMAYNYARFDNPLEFGHNYLPEFIEAKNGQFHVNYLIKNLKRIFVRQVSFKEGMGITFEKFNGFNIFVANPIYIVFVICILVCIIKKKMDKVGLTIIIATIAGIICTCLHKTLGGWQFGNRYLCDMIPFIMLYILMTKQKIRKINKISHWERFVAIFALLFNMYGILFMYLDQLQLIK